MDPQQELFTQIKLDLEALGYAVYDGFLPPGGTPYPFIYLGDFQQIDEATKTAVLGSVFPSIHVWSNTPQQRGTLSKILLDIKNTLRSIGRTKNFSWFVKSMDQRIIPDTTTAQPLLHGIIDAEVVFS
jgi:hypothetical protein